MKHTKGPWKCGTGGITMDGKSYRVEMVGNRPENEITQADLNLIAAAPEMLEVLKKVERVYGDRYPEVVNVILKAEGKNIDA